MWPSIVVLKFCGYVSPTKNEYLFYMKILYNYCTITKIPPLVSGTPTGFNATRLSSGLAHVRLSWSTVSGATGYEVYYQLSSNTPVSV